MGARPFEVVLPAAFLTLLDVWVAWQMTQVMVGTHQWTWEAWGVALASRGVLGAHLAWLCARTGRSATMVSPLSSWVRTFAAYVILHTLCLMTPVVLVAPVLSLLSFAVAFPALPLLVLAVTFPGMLFLNLWLRSRLSFAVVRTASEDIAVTTAFFTAWTSTAHSWRLRASWMLLADIGWTMAHACVVIGAAPITAWYWMTLTLALPHADVLNTRDLTP